MAKWISVLCLLALGVTVTRPAAAQELEPGAYAVAPKGLNVFVLANTFVDVMYGVLDPRIRFS